MSECSRVVGGGLTITYLRSQLCPRPWSRGWALFDSSTASPKFLGGKYIDFKRVTVLFSLGHCLSSRLFSLGQCLSKHKITRYARNLGGHGTLDPPGYAYVVWCSSDTSCKASSKRTAGAAARRDGIHALTCGDGEVVEESGSGLVVIGRQKMHSLQLAVLRYCRHLCLQKATSAIYLFVVQANDVSFLC